MYVSNYFCGLLFCTILTVVTPKPRNKNRGSSAECTAVFQSYGPAAQSTLTKSWKFDSNLTICGFEKHKKDKRRTCCTHKSEQVFRELAAQDYRRVIEEETIGARQKYQNLTRVLEESFKELLKSSRSKVVHYLSRGRRPLLAESIQSTFTHLFEAVSNGLTGLRLPDLLEVMERVQDDLFVHYLPFMVKAPGQVYNESYVQCLHGVQRKWDLFGTTANTLALELEQSVIVAGLYLRGLQISSDALEAAFEYNISNDCISDVAKLTHCSACYGEVDRKPCRSFCLDVFGACLRQVRKMEEIWHIHQQALLALGQLMIKNGPSLRATMEAIAETVELVTDHLIDNSDKFLDVITKECGTPGSSMVFYQMVPPTTDLSSQDFAFPDLFIDSSVREAEDHLRYTANNYFGRIPAQVCANDHFRDQTIGAECWDGLMQNGHLVELLDPLADYPTKDPLLEAAKLQMMRFGEDIKSLFSTNTPDESEGSGEGSGASIFEGSGGSGDTEPEDVLDRTTAKMITFIPTNRPEISIAPDSHDLLNTDAPIEEEESENSESNIKVIDVHSSEDEDDVNSSQGEGANDSQGEGANASQNLGGNESSSGMSAVISAGLVPVMISIVTFVFTQ